MAVCTGAIRRLANSAESANDISESLVSYFYNDFGDEESRNFALVRLFTTRPYFSLSQELKDEAHNSFPRHLSFPTMKCMVLQATIGEKQEWCSPAASTSHKVIPLPSDELVRQMPMIYQLISDLGLNLSDVLNTPTNLLIGSSEEDYNIFLVPDAAGSPYIPAQTTFVIPHKIKSVLGFGGLLPSGDLFAVILFSKVKISKETADMFKTIALASNLALMRFDSYPARLKTVKPAEERRKPEKAEAKNSLV
jgi:hypothetical protein